MTEILLRERSLKLTFRFTMNDWLMIAHVLVSAAEILHHSYDNGTLSMIMMTRDRQNLLLLGIISEFLI